MQRFTFWVGSIASSKAGTYSPNQPGKGPQRTGSCCPIRGLPARIAARPGWQALPAIRQGRIHEIKAPLIPSPGPAALTEALDAIVAALHWPAG